MPDNQWNFKITVLEDYTDDISKFLKIIFQNSYNTGDIPQDWLTADVIPIFKKGKKTKLLITDLSPLPLSLAN